MDKEVSLARQEEEGRSVLLAGSGSRGILKEASCGDERQTQVAPTKGHQGCQTETPAKEGKGSPTNQNRNRNRAFQKKYSGDNQTRRNSGGVEGAHLASRRSSKIVVEWLDSQCSDKPSPPHAHHWVGVSPVDKGTLFTCKYCHNFQWWPNSWEEATIFRQMIDKYGADNAYQFLLEDHPVAHDLLIRLSSLRHIRSLITDEQQLAGIILALSKE